MDSTVIVAIIAAAGTVISGLMSAIITNSVTKYRIGQLEKKVDKHNNLIERMYKVEGSIETLEHDMKNIRTKGA